MGWNEDRGRHGIICYACLGRRRMQRLDLATGRVEIVDCFDCGGTGFVKHCVGCNGTGQIKIGLVEWCDCPECSGKGYPLPKRIHVITSGLG
mgnify:FL=1